MLKTEPNIFHLVILNSCLFFANWSLKSLDYTNSYNKFVKYFLIKSNAIIYRKKEK